jgi:hypothetical protein
MKNRNDGELVGWELLGLVGEGWEINEFDLMMMLEGRSKSLILRVFDFD